MTSRLARWWGLVCLLVISLSLPAKLAALRASLWLDEAWVVNSVHAPSWREMFFYPTWLQTTPPLFLAIERVITQLAGETEIVLKLLPLAAGLGALVFVAMALRAMFSPGASLIGLALVVCNYWAAKYPQQVKQYGTDLLLTSLVLYLLSAFWTRGFPRRIFYALTVAGVFAFSAAFPAIFVVPSIVISIAASTRHRVISRAAAATSIFLIAAAQAATYLIFVRPNQNAQLFTSRAGEFLSIHNPAASAKALFLNYSALLVPAGISASLVNAAAVVVLGIAAWGAVRALLLARAGEFTGVVVILGAVLPIGGMLAASLLGQYPVFVYPRLLLWSLPCLAVLVACAIDRMIARFANNAGDFAIVLACCGAALAMDFVVLHFPRPGERNADAVAYLHQNMAADDCMFLHGGMWEQFQYYSRRTSWSPRCIYVPAFDWPCCALAIPARASTPAALSFDADVSQAVETSRGHRLWFLMPSASPGHWSGDVLFKPDIDSVSSLTASRGCRDARRKSFDQTSVLEFDCQ